MKTKLKLIAMSEIQAEEVKWLWYPYIPCGKITIVQGDPGEGKTTFVLALAALLTRGLSMPGGSLTLPPTNIIYQTAEDGLADTIKPRLDSLGADCSRVLVIDENERELTLNDHRLAQAIQETNAGLSGSGPTITKTEQAEKLILEMLESGEVASDELLHRSTALGISERTLKIAKQNLGVSAIRRGDRWYVQMAEPIQEGKGVMC